MNLASLASIKVFMALLLASCDSGAKGVESIDRVLTIAEEKNSDPIA
jgi:hypothetical protein